jgi:arabinose-5-phosphate isomerase
MFFAALSKVCASIFRVSCAIVLIEDKKIQLLVITDKDKKIKGVLHIHTLIEKGIS